MLLLFRTKALRVPGALPVSKMPRSFGPSRLRALLSIGLVLGVSTLAGGSPGLAQTDTATETPTPAVVAPGTAVSVASGTPTAAVESGTPTPTPAPSAPDISAVDPNLIADTGDGGGPRNLVKVRNVRDNQLRVDGNIQLGRIPGPMVDPVNLAESYSSCTGCQTLAVALQVDLISADSQRATPRNLALAVNYQCTDCDTIALALQYVLTVDDPTQVPDETNQLVAEMRQELKQMNGDQTLTLADAEARVINVVNQFQDLTADLDQQRDESTDPTTPNALPPT